MGAFADVHDGMSRFRVVLEGNEIARVDYVMPASTTADGHMSTAFDSVSMGVELLMQDGTRCAVTWQMDGECEGMVMGRGGIESLRPFEMELRRVEMTRSAGWQPFLGAPVIALDVGWQRSAEGCPPTVWAVRLQVDADAGLLTIALGEPGADGPTYQPDELLVIFDQAVAAAYRIPAAIA